jgi:drug/metabolite transporter (DMT)-like permease
MRRQSKATLYALTTVLIWSTVASAFKITLRHLDCFQLLFYSSSTSALTLFIILLIQNKIGFLKQLSFAEIRFSALQGLLNPFAYYLILFKAYDLLPAQEAQPLNYTWAITLSLLSVPLLKQKIRFIDLIALFISYLGVYVISTRGDIFALKFSNPLGVFLALASTVIWALYWIYNTKDHMDQVCRLFLNFLFGTLYVALVTHSFSDFELSRLAGFAGATYVGIFEMGVTFVLWATALKLTDTAARVSIFIYLSPFLSLIFIHYLVGEAILPSTYIGLVCIMLGIGLQQLKKTPRA